MTLQSFTEIAIRTTNAHNVFPASSMNYLHIILIILRRTPRTQHSHSRCKMMKKMNWSKQELWHHRNCKNKKQPCFLIPEKERSMLSRKISNSRHGNRHQHQLLKRLKQMLDCQEIGRASCRERG